MRDPHGGDLKGKHVAHMSSGFYKKELVALRPDIVFDPYSEYSFAFESLRNGKIDAITIGWTYADIWLAKFVGEFRIAFEYAVDVCGFLLKKDFPLKLKLDAELRRMNASGETDAIYRKWVEAVKEGELPGLPRFNPPADAPEVRVACAALSEPWCFVANGEIVGIDSSRTRWASPATSRRGSCTWMKVSSTRTGRQMRFSIRLKSRRRASSSVGSV